MTGVSFRCEAIPCVAGSETISLNVQRIESARVLAIANLLVHWHGQEDPAVLQAFIEAARYAGDHGPRLGHMGRPKTISDDAVLRIARDVFREHGHTATTREVAQAVGISEPILYRRFGSKDALFFAAMHAQGPEIDELLGPVDPPGDASEYLMTVLQRLGSYFAEVIPLALRVMMLPVVRSGIVVSHHTRRPGGPAGGAGEAAGLTRASERNFDFG